MEKTNKKNGIIGIIIAAIIILSIICFAVFGFKSGEKATNEKDLKTITELYENYIFGMTLGYSNQYLGVDKLYSKNETKYEDLHKNVILNIASKYVTTNNLDNSISELTIENIESQYGYDTSKYMIFKGEAIKEAVKILFDKDLSHESGINDSTYGFDFIYISSFDVYLKTKNDAYIEPKNLEYLEYKKTNSTTTKDSIELEIAIAYVHEINDEIIYTSDAESNNIIFKTTKDKKGIQNKYLDKFQKYIITFKRNQKDNTFTFDSIKKVK